MYTAVYKFWMEEAQKHVLAIYQHMCLQFMILVFRMNTLIAELRSTCDLPLRYRRRYSKSLLASDIPDGLATQNIKSRNAY